MGRNWAIAAFAAFVLICIGYVQAIPFTQINSYANDTNPVFSGNITAPWFNGLWNGSSAYALNSTLSTMAWNQTNTSYVDWAHLNMTNTTYLTYGSWINQTNTSNYICNSTGSCFTLQQLNASPDLSGYVPYTGATSTLDLGSHDLTTTGTGTFGSGNPINIGGSSGTNYWDTAGNIQATGTGTLGSTGTVANPYTPFTVNFGGSGVNLNTYVDTTDFSSGVFPHISSTGGGIIFDYPTYFDGGSLYTDGVGQLFWPLDNGGGSGSGGVFFGNFDQPYSGVSAGFSIPGSVVMAINSAHPRMGVGGGYTFISTAPMALAEFQPTEDIPGISISKGNIATHNILQVTDSSYNPFFSIDSSGNLNETGTGTFGTASIFGDSTSNLNISVGGDGSVGNVNIGSGAYAYGNSATAIGSGAFAADLSTALGYRAYAPGVFSTALGYSAYAAGDLSTALGNGAYAADVLATAIGSGAYAYGNSATAIGGGAYAYGNSATAIGYGATANNDFSTVIGIGVTDANAPGGVTLGGYNPHTSASENWLMITPATSGGGNMNIAGTGTFGTGSTVTIGGTGSSNYWDPSISVLSVGPFAAGIVLGGAGSPSGNYWDASGNIHNSGNIVATGTGTFGGLKLSGGLPSTGGNAGTSACVDANGELCACGSCA